MDKSETQPVIEPETEDMKQQCACLQRQITTLLLALVIVSGTLTVFLWRQARYARRDLESTKAPIENSRKNKAAMDAFIARIAEFGRTHPDFAPIMTKYRIPMPTGAPPATATAPAPATTAPPKK